MVKTLFHARRPFQYEGREHLKKIEDDSATGTSFPSGHSQISGTVYTSFALNCRKYYVIIICVLMMILVPLSRLYLGVHFPRDVVVGTILGILVAVGGYYLYNKFYDKKLIVNLVLVALGIPFIFLKNSDKDFFKGYGLFIGFVIGSSLEKEEVYNFSLKEKILRFLFGAIIVLPCFILLNLFNHLDFVQSNQAVLRITYITSYGIIGLLVIYVVPLLLRLIHKKIGGKNE